MDTYTPFCGIPPLPTELLTRWLFDPVLLVGLAAALMAGLVWAEDRQRMIFGWALVAFLFISPICAASMSLFSARVLQHVLLTLVAAPVIATSLPRIALPSTPVAIGFAILFWGWHAPLPYALTLQSDLVYWAMHLSLTGTAVMLFAALRATPERGIPAAVLTSLQMTIYAVMLTLAPTAWHEWHELTALPYGMTALGDQQLAGAIMWVAGGAVFMALVGWMTWRFLRDDRTVTAQA